MKRLALLLLAINMLSCTPPQQEQKNIYSAYNNPEFSKYWNKGLAELNSYNLKQSRYGDVRDGEAVLIFVTETFSAQKQVKLDDPEQNKDDILPIMKLNFSKKFITGIYPYSMMASIFTPLSGSLSPVKISTTSQEWCGHTFTQLNSKSEGYEVRLYSYFESEGDSSFKAKEAIAEDGIWNIIRIDPTQLPTGQVNMIPGTLYQRLSHNKLWTGIADCKTEEINYAEYGMVNRYSVYYAVSKRSLDIYFEKTFPHKILGWSESYPDISGQPATTTATLKKSIQLDYWKHNGIADTTWRDSLKVRF